MSIRHIVNIMNFLKENPKLALYVKNFNDEKTGFILCPHEEIKEIQEGVAEILSQLNVCLDSN